MFSGGEIDDLTAFGNSKLWQLWWSTIFWWELEQIIVGMEASTNLNDLVKKITRARKILGRKKEFLSALAYSMPSHVDTVVDAKGDVTKY